MIEKLGEEDRKKNAAYKVASIIKNPAVGYNTAEVEDI